MDYNKLETLVLVADLGSITAAAQTLRRTQSAISQQIQGLEADLELKLLERRSGRIYLSKDGERIYALAKEKLGQIRDGVLDLKKATETAEGHIVVGALNDFGTDFDVGTAIGSFCGEHPKVTFEVRSGTSPEVERDLLENKIDLGILVVFRVPEMFVRKPVQKSWHSLYTSTAYAKRVEPIRSCRDLLDKSLIDLDEQFMGIGTFVAKNARTLLSTLRRRRPDIIAPNLRVAKSVMMAGFGIAMLPDFLVEKEVKDKKVARVLEHLKPLSGGMDVAHRIHRTLRLCEKLFIHHLITRSESFRLRV